MISALFMSDLRNVSSLRGHESPIMCLAFSPKGNMLASGGVDTLKIWDIKTSTEIRLPDMAYYERAKVCCVSWLTSKDEEKDILCYGNAQGYLVFLQHNPEKGQMETMHIRRIGHGGEILTLTAHVNPASTERRLATATRDKCVQIWSFDTNTRILTALLSKVYGDDKDVIPRAVAFDKNDNKDFWVFGLYDGGLYKYNGKDAKNITQLQLSSQIGSVAVDAERRICVVDNVGGGFDMYDVDTAKFLRAFKVGEPVRTYARGVSFADNSQAVIGGSDHGRVYIFGVRDGRVLKALKHSGTGVETIGVHDHVDGSVLIATASSSTSPGPVRIWRWIPDRKKYEGQGSRMEVVDVIRYVLQALMFCATVAYSYELYKKTISSTDPGLERNRAMAAQHLNVAMKTVKGIAGRIFGELDFGQWR